MKLQSPTNPINAVTHPDPYPFYAALTTHKPFYYDEGSKLWVASSAEAVTAVLTSAFCRVRPASEPVPAALIGSSAGEIFGHLVRMNDGERHTAFKRVISSTLAQMDYEAVSVQCHHWARVLMHHLPEHVSDFTFVVSVYVIGDMFGIASAQLPEVALWVADFVRCIAPGSSPEQIEQGKQAAEKLLMLVNALLHQPGVVLKALMQSAGDADTAVIVANAIGFFTQAYEATAGLIGNTLLALHAHPDLYAQVSSDPTLIMPLLREVLRHDAPVQNTRRFVVEDGVIMGQSIKSGEVILVVLAAANRDASVNLRPECFTLLRQDHQMVSFGAGVHACPGESLAMLIGGAGVQAVLSSGMDLPAHVTYRASGNTRVPLFE